MSYKWPNKDPDEQNVDYNVDWSRFLGDDTISSVDWYIYDADGNKGSALSDSTVVNGLQFVTKSTNTANTVATIRLSLGTNNVRYRIVCRINTSDNGYFERSIYLRVKEK